MATGKRFWLTLPAAAPDRTDGVDDVARRQASRGSCDCLSGGKTADAPDNLPASLEDGWPSCAMDGAIHTAAARREELAAFTMASACWRVMSPGPKITR